MKDSVLVAVPVVSFAGAIVFDSLLMGCISGVLAAISLFILCKDRGLI